MTYAKHPFAATQTDVEPHRPHRKEHNERIHPRIVATKSLLTAHIRLDIRCTLLSYWRDGWRRDAKKIQHHTHQQLRHDK